MMVKNIIFDLGGVVLEWNPQRVEKEYKGNLEMPRFLFNSGFFQTHWAEFDRGTITQTKLVEKMAELSGYPLAECEGFVEFVKYSLDDIPQTVELIKKFSEQGYSVYCLSNMSLEFYDYLKVRDWFSCFKGQIISALEGVIKPEAAIYELLLDRFQLKAEECLFIDDLAPNIEAAKALGIQTVHFAEREKGYAEIEQLVKQLD